MSFLQTHKKKKIAAITSFIAGAGWFFYHQNNALETTEAVIASERVPQAFDGFKIVHLSDLHQKRYGKNQSLLIETVKKQSPDLIAFTGDLIDARKRGLKPGVTMLEELAKLAPVYYVTGNHEGKMEGYSFWIEKAKSTAVHLMQGEVATIKKGEDKISLIGVDDPEVIQGYVEGEEMEAVAEKEIRETLEKADTSFKLLLSHRPELFPVYVKHGIDLTLSGHAHGGQIRLPFIGGLFAPGQGLFPTYTTGKYAERNSYMVVSRGLGPTIFPTRLFNRPEVMTIILKTQRGL